MNNLPVSSFFNSLSSHRQNFQGLKQFSSPDKPLERFAPAAFLSVVRVLRCRENLLAAALVHRMKKCIARNFLLVFSRQPDVIE
ncbi:MAG: hypothetical protein ACOX5Z_10210 [Desulfobulbus sp.]